MQLDTRLARLLHVLIHMHLKGGSTTSETIAQMLHTNPALVRRTMASLREARYVESGRGPGGGWTLACDLSEVTVKDIYVALAYKGIFAWGPAEDNPQCPVESVVNEYLENALGSAENALLTIIGNTKLSHLVQKIVVPDTKASSLAASKKQAK